LSAASLPVFVPSNVDHPNDNGISAHTGHDSSGARPGAPGLRQTR
jgi:hypothetical protein